ncbi:MAG: GMP synthase [Gammaproteobacteria bacterium]
MIIGIIEADELDDDVLEHYGSYTDRFQQLLFTADPQLSFRTYCAVHQRYPQDINACDAYLITGSKYSCYEEIDWIKRLERFIVDCYQQDKKLIGICFGHQLIAQALGGQVRKSDKGWSAGLISNDVVLSPGWLSPAQQRFSLLVNHQDQVFRLPVGASLIATNDFCPVSGYQVNRSMLTFQGHPEFSRDYLRYLITKNRQEIGDQVYLQATQSLEQHVDYELVATWIVKFIRDQS